MEGCTCYYHEPDYEFAVVGWGGGGCDLVYIVEEGGEEVSFEGFDIEWQANGRAFGEGGGGDGVEGYCYLVDPGDWGPFLGCCWCILCCVLV